MSQPGLFQVISQNMMQNRQLTVQATSQFVVPKFEFSIQTILFAMLCSIMLCLICFSSKTGKFLKFNLTIYSN